MDWKTFLANLIRSLILIAAAVVLFLWVLGRDRDARAPGSVTGFQWRQRQVEEARPTVPTEPRFEFVPPADRTPRPFPAPDQAERRPVVTEAYDRLGAAEYHAAGYLGQGVTVAVVDTQFDGLENAISAGEIPATVTARRLMPDGELVDSLQSGDGPHGTACAEIIHDLAPGAQLYLLQVDSFLVTAERMFEILEQAGVRVVSLSISVLAIGRADGTGVLGDPPVPIYDILRDAYENKDMLIVMSAGNYARQHYAGPFRDLDNDGIHEVLSHTRRGSTESVTVAAEEDSAFFVHLSWDDWGPDPMAPSATSDYDLYVYDEADNLVASSTVTQGNGLPPVESVRIAPERDTTYAIQVRQTMTTSGSHHLRIWVTSDRLPLNESQTPQGSLGPPADAEAVLTAGAANAMSDWRLATSSQGPTSDGRIKPDVTSYAHVSVSGPAYGPQGFTGTSAATPHVAGMAALLLNASGTAMPAAALKDQLLSFVGDRGDPGPDSVWGAGIAALPPLGAEVVMNQPDPGDKLLLDGDGAASLLLTVVRTDGTPVPGLGPDAFQVALDGESADVVTVQDLRGQYVLRVRWPSGTTMDAGGARQAQLTVAALDTLVSVPVRVSAVAAASEDTGPQLIAVTTAQLYEAGDFVQITAALEHGAPVTNALIIADISAPMGRRDIVTLRDDGHSGDGVAGDGVYGWRYPQTQIPGRYTFRLTAYAEAERTEVLATGEMSVDVATNLRNEDRDGMPSKWEMEVGLNHLANDRFRDQDADGLTNTEEYRSGSDPFNWDTDGDWINDFDEVNGYYKLLPYSADSDGGGTDDGAELRNGTDPLNPEDDTQAPNVILLPLALRAYTPPWRPTEPR